MPPDQEILENWRLLQTPLGEPWSGRARYAAAMFFYQRGVIDAEVLEVYRICSRLDWQDPFPILADRGLDADWRERIYTNLRTSAAR